MEINEIDLVIGNNEKNNIVDIINEKLNSNSKRECKVSDISKQREYLDFGAVEYNEKTRAVIKVQDGCDNFCTYCIIPYAKGRVRSRDIENIVSEAQQVVRNGIKEIVITGIHIASYGKDLGNIGLIDLLERLDEIPDLKRIRLGSLEPKLISEEFVERLKRLNKICNHFHLSLQSGCNATLRRMNRRYTTEEFEYCVKLLRDAFSDVAITTDIIVGFPQETDEEFEITYEFLKKIKLCKMHIFKYSQRDGTVAAKMDGQITPDKKEERSRKLIELSNENEMEFLNSYINKEVEVLFEERAGEYYKGYTSNYMCVKKKTSQELNNQIRGEKIGTIHNLELIAMQ